MKLSRRVKKFLKDIALYIMFFVLTEGTIIACGLYFLNNYSF